MPSKNKALYFQREDTYQMGGMELNSKVKRIEYKWFALTKIKKGIECNQLYEKISMSKVNLNLSHGTQMKKLLLLTCFINRNIQFERILRSQIRPQDNNEY